MTKAIENAWKNVRFTPARIERPATVKEVQSIVDQARVSGQKIKVIGGGHSMNDNFRTDGILVDLSRLNRILSVDPATGVAEVEAGVTLGDAIVEFANHKLHFPSLGSWHSQSIAGAIATSTHGSSLSHGSLSDIVVEIEAVLADGKVHRFSGSGNEVRAMRCHLGLLGILTKVKLKLSPAFCLSCAVTRHPAPWAFGQILDTARSNEYVNMLWIPDLDMACIRMLTSETPCPRNQVALDLEHRFVHRSMLSFRIEDVGFFVAAHLYQLMPRRYGPRYCRFVQKAFFDDQGVSDTSYRVFLYDQYREPTENNRLRMIMNVEYAFDVKDLAPVLMEMRARLQELRARGHYLNYPRVHVRFAPRSDATLTGLNADRDTAYVGIYVLGSVRHKRQIPIALEIEELFLRHGGRPHWGKYRYLTTRSFEDTYQGFAAFEAVRHKLDPDDMFSAKQDMFHGLNRFARPERGAMLRSVFDPDEYQEIRLL
ncbi:MAG: FAD-binding protein [Methyloceanibacter sp.]